MNLFVHIRNNILFTQLRNLNTPTLNNRSNDDSILHDSTAREALDVNTRLHMLSLPLHRIVSF